MANVNDVAAALLRETGPIDTWRFQKLMYYAQAWSLVWDGVPLFPNRIEAWANGPVVRDLYPNHRGKFQLDSWQWGKPDNLNQSELETIRAVVRDYGSRPGHWLSALTHQESPWLDARAGLGPGERGDREITHGAMAEYYGSFT